MSLSEAKRLHSQGRQKLADGDLQGAVDKFKKALQFHPNYYQTFLGLGDVMQKLTRPEQAIAYYNQVLAIKPNHHQALHSRANALCGLNRNEEALASYDKAQKANPRCVDGWNHWGALLCELGRYEEALNCYNRALRLKSDEYEIWLQRGRVLLQLKCYEEALVSYDKAIKIKPDNFYAWYGNGTAFFYLNCYEEALTSYDRAIEIKFDNIDAWSSRGSALRKLGRYEEALASYSKVFELDPNYVDAWFKQGLTLHNMGHYEDAIASYDRAIEIQPKQFNAWNNRGSSLWSLDRHEEALTSFIQASKFDPKQTTAWNGQGDALFELGRYEEAITSYEKVIQLQPDTPDVHYRRGNALSKLQRYKEAIASYNKAIELRTDFSSAYTNCGNALWQLGRYEEALQGYEKAIELEPNSPFAHCGHGDALWKLGKHEQALISYKKTITLKADYYFSYNGQGNVLWQLGRYEEALQSYKKAIELEPNSPFAHCGHGDALWKLGKHEQALISYNRAIELNSSDPLPYNGRGNALLKLGRYEEAIASYNQSIAIKPDYYWAWLGRGDAASNLPADGSLRSFYLPSTIQHSSLNQGGYRGQRASYIQGLKYVSLEAEPEGWSRLHRAIGNSHYYEGRQSNNPYLHWRQAVRHYDEVLLKALTPSAFPELYLEVLNDQLRACLGLQDVLAAEVCRHQGTDVLRRLLSDTQRTDDNKRKLALKFAGFNQLTVDTLVQSKQILTALETAERGKNACLTWLLYAWSDEITSPSYETMQQLLDPTTAIVYWHLSPAALTTFVLKSGEPAPILITTPTFQSELPESLQRLLKFEAWMQDWDRQYQDYRGKGKKQPNNDHSWRQDMQQRLFERQEEPGNLKDILNIEAIEQHLAGITQLILIPHRDLHRFPLRALFSPSFTITYLPSAQVGITLQQRQPSSTSRLLSIENPDSALGFARVEAEGIYQCFSQLESIQENHATKEQVEVALNGEFTVFHFAGHAEHIPSDPRKSRLILANPGDAPSNKDELSQSLTNNWTIEDLCQHDFSSYDLITLSACETALTNNQAITTEYVGLVSGFLRSGAAQVVSTLWTVESAASALVMIEFYQRRQSSKSDAAALAEAVDWLKNLTVADLKQWCNNFLAQLPADLPEERKERIEGTLEKELARWGSIESDKMYGNPYYWAAFAISGRFS